MAAIDFGIKLEQREEYRMIGLVCARLDSNQRPSAPENDVAFLEK
jgi:hypothetical protein